MKTIAKRLVITLVIAALVCGGIYGGLTVYKNTNTGPVRVYSVSEVSYPAEYYMEDSTAYGSVSLDRMQTVYVSGTQQVKEILVTEGGQVKKGDVLFTYDTTLTSIQIEKAENELAQQQLALKRAKEELEKIGKLSPSSESLGGGDDGTGSDAEEEKSPYEKPWKEELKAEDTPLRLSGSGTISDPYVYLWGSRDAFTSEELLLMFRPDDWGNEEEGGTVSGTEAVSLLRMLGLLPYTVYASDEIESGVEAPDDADVENAAESPDTGDPEPEEIETETPDTPVETGNEETGSTSGNVEEGQESDSGDAAETGTESGTGDADLTIEGDSDHYVDLSGCPNEVWVILEVHESDNREGATLTRFGLHLIRDEQDVAVRLYNPDAAAADGSSRDASDDAAAGDSSDDAGDDIDLDDGGDDGDADDGDDDDDTGSSSSLISKESDIDFEASYTAKEIEDLKKQKTKEVRDLDLDVRQSELSLKQMKEEAGDGSVRAKINGEIKIVRDPTDAYQNNEPVVTVSGGGGYNIRIGISELELDKLKTGDQVEVTSFSAESTTFPGEIVSVSDYPESSSDGGWWGGNPNVTYYGAVVYVDGDAELREYDYVSVKYGDATARGKMMLEKMFVLSDTGGSYVYKRTEDEILSKTYIKTGSSPDSSMIEVLEGLSEDDYVAFPYGKNVSEGAPTEVSDIDKLYEE